jgi:prepilin-type N-terminal cleavage/methylation domain-containing protein
MKPIRTRNVRQARGRRGFSLVELLFVVALLSCLAAVAIFSLSDVTGASTVAKSRRNAQSFCQTYASARAAGADFRSATKEGILDELIEGKAGRGAFRTSRFQFPIAVQEKAALLEFCKFEPGSGMLLFHYQGDGS